MVTCVFNGEVVKLPGGSLFDFLRLVACILEVCDVVLLIFSSGISSFSFLVVVGSLFWMKELIEGRLSGLKSSNLRSNS